MSSRTNFIPAKNGVDISDADAGVGEVLSPKTFYAVALPRKTGIMATRTLNAANETVDAGYYAATTLSAVDGDLASGNIRATITIFGFAGSNDVRDISDADLVVAEAPTGKFFYAVSGGRKTGSGTKTLNPANETVAAGYYAATTLSAVDGDLAVGNIKSGITIFGFLGTYVSSLTAEDMSVTSGAGASDGNEAFNIFLIYHNIVSGGDETLTTKTATYGGGEVIAGTGDVFKASIASAIKLQLVMGGVMVDEDSYLDATISVRTLVNNKVLSGSQTVLLRAHNYDGSTRAVYRVSRGSGSASGYPRLVIGAVVTS